MDESMLPEKPHRWQWFGRHRGSEEESASQRAQPGWRSTMLAWTAVVIAILLVNIGVLIWAIVRKTPELPETAEDSSPREGNPILYLGDCDTVSRIKTWTHLAINIASSLLLLASANCMQCLSSPTREEINKAHTKGCFVDIGILSSRNFRHIGVGRACLWVLLAMSSLPLHLFYNSTIFTTIGARSINTILASREFLDEHDLNKQSLNESIYRSLRAGQSHFYQGWTAPLQTNALAMMPQSSHYTGQSLSTEDCLNTFSATAVSMYKSVTVVLDVANASQILWAAAIDANGMRQPWSCYDAAKSRPKNVEGLLNSCKLCDDLAITGTSISTICDEFNFPAVTWAASPAILSCETEPAPGFCGVELVLPLLVIVIVANSVKALIMIATILLLKFQPLINIGDAIRSFLIQPDAHTRNGSPISCLQIPKPPPVFNGTAWSTYDHGSQNFQRYLQQWHGEQHRIAVDICQKTRNGSWATSRFLWFKAISKTRWCLTISLCMVLEIVAGALLSTATTNRSSNMLEQSRQSGIGAVDPRFYTGFDAQIIGLSALTNAPQLAVSIAYIGYYSLFSSMLGVAEAFGYAVVRKGLRVSQPQRGTYWLTIPFKYGFALLASMTTLHWLISQSIFIVRLNRVDSGALTRTGADNIYWNFMNGFGFSPVAIVASMCLGFATMLGPLFLGWRKLPGGMPIVGHNSLAISSACHSDPIDPVDMTEKPLMYGVLRTPGKTGRRRVGFSSLEVEPLVDGEVYECRRCPQSLVTPDSAMWDCCKEAEAEEEKQGDVVSDATGRANERGSDDSYCRGISCDLGDGRIESEATQEAMSSESQSLLTQQHVERHLIPRKPVPISHG